MAGSLSLNELCRIAQNIIKNSSAMSLDSETEEKLKNIARYLESVYAPDRCRHETLRTAHDKAMGMLEQYHRASKTALALLEEAYKAVQQSKKEEQTLLADLDFVHKKSNLPEDIRTNALGMLQRIQYLLDTERSKGKFVMDSLQNELNYRMDWMKACLHGPESYVTCESSPCACVDAEDETRESVSPTDANGTLDNHSLETTDSTSV